MAACIRDGWYTIYRSPLLVYIWCSLVYVNLLHISHCYKKVAVYSELNDEARCVDIGLGRHIGHYYTTWHLAGLFQSRYLVLTIFNEGVIWHLSQSSVRPSNYFSSIVKSRSNPFLEPTSIITTHTKTTHTRTTHTGTTHTRTTHTRTTHTRTTHTRTTHTPFKK